MLCTLTISNVAITKTLIDGGADLNVLYVETFEMLQVRLSVTFGTRTNYRTELIDFDVARIDLSYNAILGYLVLAKFMAVTHPGYNVIKMPGNGGIITMTRDRKDVARALKLAYRAAATSRLDTEGTPGAPEAAPARKKHLFSKDHDETKKVPADDANSGPAFTIGAGLPPEQEQALVSFLRANKDVFTWKASDLVSVPREVIEHPLAVCPNARPVKQKARRQAQEKQAFIVQEVHKLHEAGAIREVRHPEWLANPVVLPKKSGQECMCVDFTSFNKIKMAAGDVEKTAFISPCGVYCYTCMPFRLRSAGATFR
ncbi:uncharacterized protein [Aegilops tauschii subsp. strangulata]|uniref:uncharacterized protein n=1 Tax=Aegilops tauschii subsp. strangulata TaxID=200361 RepID=UPI003CC8BC54